MSYQPPQPQNPYGQPPYPPRPPKKYKVHPAIIIGGVLGGVFLILVVIGAIVGPPPAKKTSSTAAAPTPTATTSTANKGASSAAPPIVKATKPQPAPQTTAPAQPAPAPAKPITVLTEHGNGIKSTASFTVTGDWDLAYAFDCSNFGGQGNFAVSINGSAGDVLVNELAAKGADTTHQHDGPGKIALDINSECVWSIRVDQLP
jgi:hypothetical protein